jgi:hypothetical protein
LRVNSFLNVIPQFKNLDEYKEFANEYARKEGFTEKQIKTILKYSKKSMELSKNINGTIGFDLYEYKENKSSMIGVNSGVISIKTSESKKIKANLSSTSFLMARLQ